jgi:hypothetical protein
LYGSSRANGISHLFRCLHVGKYAPPPLIDVSRKSMEREHCVKEKKEHKGEVKINWVNYMQKGENYFLY